MKIINREKGDTIKYSYIEIELKDKRVAEITLTENYHINTAYTDFNISIVNDEKFTKKEIEKIKKFIEDNNY